jgi:hypothetical protein
MKEIKIFLNEILTAQSITKDIRKKALLLRDSIDLSEKVSDTLDAPVAVLYNGYINGKYEHNLSLVRLNQCYNLAKNGRHPDQPGKISFIKELRSNYRCGLKEAKELAEHLHFKGILRYE